jgi:periplasmic divalent cation tolerance protein
MAADVVQVTTTLPDADAAERVALAVLEARLAACAQVDGPVTSRYWWDGALETATEWRCTIKTTAGVAERTVAAVVAAHPCDVPEVLVTAVAGGHEAYLDWVASAIA